MPRRAAARSTKKNPCGCATNPRRARRNPDESPDEPLIEPARVTPGVPADLGSCLQWVKLEKVPSEYAACMDRLGQFGKIQTAKDAYEALKGWYEKQDQEIGVVLLLDVQLNVRGAAEVSRGERDSTVVPIPDILRVALVDGATAIVFCHNHPTGSSTPSDDDKTSTVALDEACQTVGLMLMDHVVFGRDEYYSFADSGLLKSEPVMPADVEPEPTPWVEPEREEPFVDNPLASDRTRWDALHASYATAIEAVRNMQISLRVKYGDSNWRTWSSRGDRNKLEKLEERANKIGDKIVELLVRISPRGEAWLSGGPAWWIREKLTWEDAVRPVNEALSVEVPAPFGATHGLREALVEDRSSGARRGWEHRRERDEWVVQNLDPALIPLWTRIGTQFRGTPEERYEQFVQYVHDHPGEETAAIQAGADAWLDAEVQAGRARENPLDRSGKEITFGDRVDATWTWGGREYQGDGVVTKANAKSVKVRLNAFAGDHFHPGFVVTTTPHRVQVRGEATNPRRFVTRNPVDMRALIDDELYEWALYPLGPKPGYLAPIAGDAGEDIYQVNRLYAQLQRMNREKAPEGDLDEIAGMLGDLIAQLTAQVKNASTEQIEKYTAARTRWIES